MPTLKCFSLLKTVFPLSLPIPILYLANNITVILQGLSVHTAYLSSKKSIAGQYNAVGTSVDYEKQSCGYNKLQLKRPCHRVSSLTNTKNVSENIRGRYQMNFSRMRKTTRNFCFFFFLPKTSLQNLEKLTKVFFFIVSIHLHPCHPQQQTTLNSFSAVRKALITMNVISETA